MSLKAKEIILSKNIWLGDPKAPVKLVEFGDYQSEACSRANEVVKLLMEKFSGKVKYSFRHFPLSKVNQFAMKAAEAAVSAAQECKFWEMHNILFANRRHLGTISLKSYAKEIGIVDKRFLDNLVNSTFSWQVRDDLLEGLKLGVREVPAFFINGKLFTAEASFENLNKAIEQSLLMNNFPAELSDTEPA
jgi:protein-disulfide isomerase